MSLCLVGHTQARAPALHKFEEHSRGRLCHNDPATAKDVNASGHMTWLDPSASLRTSPGGSDGAKTAQDVLFLRPVQWRFLLTDFRLSLIIRTVRPRAASEEDQPLALGLLAFRQRWLLKGQQPCGLWPTVWVPASAASGGLKRWEKLSFRAEHLPPPPECGGRSVLAAEGREQLVISNWQLAKLASTQPSALSIQPNTESKRH